MKKPFLKRMGDFLEGKGFYIVLFLCVAAIGISGYYLFSSLTPDEPDAPVAGTAQITVTPSPRPTPVDAGLMNRPAATPAPEHTVPASPAVPAATPSAMPSATPQPTPQAAPTVFTWPVQGDILTDYSLEVLSYNPTMDDWRTHDGLDIASAAGTEVKAAAAGTVTAILQDGHHRCGGARRRTDQHLLQPGLRTHGGGGRHGWRRLRAGLGGRHRHRRERPGQPSALQHVAGRLHC